MAAGVESRRPAIVSKSTVRTKQFTLRTFEKAASTFSQRSVDLRRLTASCGRGAPLSRLYAACHYTSSFLHVGTKVPWPSTKTGILMRRTWGDVQFQHVAGPFPVVESSFLREWVLQRLNRGGEPAILSGPRGINRASMVVL